MEDWLEDTKKLIYRSLGEDLSSADYKLLIRIFHEHMSNRNLAKLLSQLFNKEEIGYYMEIDKIMANEDYDEENIKTIRQKLNNGGFEEWIDME